MTTLSDTEAIIAALQRRVFSLQCQRQGLERRIKALQQIIDRHLPDCPECGEVIHHDTPHDCTAAIVAAEHENGEH